MSGIFVAAYAKPRYSVDILAGDSAGVCAAMSFVRPKAGRRRGWQVPAGHEVQKRVGGEKRAENEERDEQEPQKLPHCLAGVSRLGLSRQSRSKFSQIFFASTPRIVAPYDARRFCIVRDLVDFGFQLFGCHRGRWH